MPGCHPRLSEAAQIALILNILCGFGASEVASAFLVVALNRAIAIGPRDGADRGIEELHAVADRERLSRYPFYPAAIGELELRRGNRDAAREHFAAARSRVTRPSERFSRNACAPASRRP